MTVGTVIAVAIGGGGHARVVIDAARAAGFPTFHCVVDQDRSLHGGMVAGLKVTGGDEVLSQLVREGVGHFVVTVGSVGDAAVRRRLFDFATGTGMEAATVVHPSAVLAPSARVGAGSVVFAAAVINPDVEIGSNVIVNTAAVIEHDCRIASHAHIAPRATLGGGVSVGEGAHIGMGAVIRQGLSIGPNALIGAGAVVVKDVPDGATVVGNPARPRPEAS